LGNREVSKMHRIEYPPENSDPISHRIGQKFI
jgi:hypothetical protein